MTRYYIDQIDFRSLEGSLKKLEAAKGPVEMSLASINIVQALGGGNPARAPEMIRYLVEKAQKDPTT